MNDVWSVLGIDPTNEEGQVRRAYARKLKEIHIEAEPGKFQELREAYEEIKLRIKYDAVDDDFNDDFDHEDVGEPISKEEEARLLAQIESQYFSEDFYTQAVDQPLEYEGGYLKDVHKENYEEAFDRVEKIIETARGLGHDVGEALLRKEIANAEQSTLAYRDAFEDILLAKLNELEEPIASLVIVASGAFEWREHAGLRNQTQKQANINYLLPRVVPRKAYKSPGMKTDPVQREIPTWVWWLAFPVVLALARHACK